VPVSYELTPANVAEVRLAEELLTEADLREEVGRRLLGDLAYQSEALEEALAECGVVAGDRAFEAARQEAARGDLLFEPQAGVRAREDFGQDAGGARHEDRGQDNRLTPTVSTSIASWVARKDGSRTCGPNLATDI
jgi:hypothetical protein